MNGRILLLGSGTSTGVPIIGKRYPDSFVANPKNHRLRQSAVIQSNGATLLVDCSPDMRTQLIRYGIFDIDEVLITHTHADHVMGMDDLRAFCLKYGRAIRVYAQEDSQVDIRRIFPYMYAEFPAEIFVPRIELVPVPPVLKVGGFEVETMTVGHGVMNVIALRMGDVAYVTDVKTIADAEMDRLRDLDVLILDAVRFRPHPNHMNFEEAMVVVDRLKPKLTYFTHLSDDYDHDEFEKTLPPHIRLAYDGLEIEF